MSAGEVTTTQHAEPFTNPDDPVVNVHRKPLRLVGNAYDINRVLQACQAALKHIEQNGGEVESLVTVYVQEPQNDEP
jgi:hypothetical protein